MVALRVDFPLGRPPNDPPPQLPAKYSSKWWHSSIVVPQISSNSAACTHARTSPRLVALRFRQCGTAGKETVHMERFGSNVLSLAGETPYANQGPYWRHGSPFEMLSACLKVRPAGVDQSDLA